MSEKNEEHSKEMKAGNLSEQATDAELTTSSEIEAKEEQVAVEEENQLVRMIDATNLVIEEHKYEIVMNYRDGFSIEKLTERYSEILTKYDYIVADWGFDQLRLKGFYEDKNHKVPQEQRIGSLQDYLYEFCNFGCAYFVLKRTGGPAPKEKNPRSKRPRNRNNTAKDTNRTNKGKDSAATPKNKNYSSAKANQPARGKKEPSRNTSKQSKKNFVTKKVQDKTENKPRKETRKPAVETVTERNGQRHFNIRRNDVEKVKNKE